MNQIITNNMNEIFFDHIQTAKENILLCAPFVKSSIITQILKEKNSQSKFHLITNFTYNHFFKNASDIEAMQQILESNFSITNCQTLHAKIYTFDHQHAIVTSANLTYSGFYKNFKLGLLTNDAKTNKNLNSTLNQLILENEKITPAIVTQIEKMLKEAPKRPSYQVENEIDEIYQIQADEIYTTLQKGWTQEVYQVINQFEKSQFDTQDIYQYTSYFQARYPNNHHIEDKIRQQLQILRDVGLLKFLGNGNYKKLWRK